MNNPKIVLFDIDYTLFDTKAFKDSKLKNYYLYEEVLHVLEELVKVAELGIFSMGDTEFQNRKLVETGIANYFKDKNVHVFSDKEVKLKDMLDKYQQYKVFLVDDRLTVLHNAKTMMPSIFTIWVKRGPFAQVQGTIPGFAPNSEVFDLNEIIKIIKSQKD